MWGTNLIFTTTTWRKHPRDRQPSTLWGALERPAGAGATRQARTGNNSCRPWQEQECAGSKRQVHGEAGRRGYVQPPGGEDHHFLRHQKRVKVDRRLPGWLRGGEPGGGKHYRWNILGDAAGSTNMVSGHQGGTCSWDGTILMKHTKWGTKWWWCSLDSRALRLRTGCGISPRVRQPGL